MKSSFYCILLVALIFSACKLSSKEKATQLKHKNPNIVLIMADDLGYSDVGYMNYKEDILTPNIDKLANSGMVFTNAYAACTVCSPTRASLMTGKSPAALKLTTHIPGKPMDEYLISNEKGMTMKGAFFIDHLLLEEITIAEVLKEQGYHTGFLGKWHLAGAGSTKTKDGIVNANYHPDKQGFDVNIGGCAYGQPRSYFSPYRNGTIEDGEDGEYLTDRLGDEAVKFINENKDHPFFLNLSTYTVHNPLKAPEETIEKYNGNTYFAMIEKLDQNVGKVMNRLKELNLLENTIVIFYSDNGGVYGNAPLRSGKNSLYEGGIRVPLIVSWPGKIKAGSRCEEPVTTVDFFPTFLELVNVSSQPYPQLEGVSIIPLLTGKKKLPERALYWHFPHNRGPYLAMGAVIRDGDWKLAMRFDREEIHLYNLKEDLGEENNLYLKYPEKTKYLIEKLEKWQKSVDAEFPPTYVPSEN
jgi:arylsulfatase A-like enzyme